MRSSSESISSRNLVSPDALEGTRTAAPRQLRLRLGLPTPVALRHWRHSAAAEFPDSDAELLGLVGEICRDARTGKVDDPDR
jgi:hypothetical protein